MLIGLPRVLSFYYLFPLYRTFLQELGIQYVETPPSTKSDLENMRLCPTDEPCISVKVAFSHAKRLLDQGVDSIFVPSVISLSSRSYCCPKMMGLPFMLRSGLGLKKDQVISPLIDEKDGRSSWKETWVEAADRMSGVNGLSDIRFNRKRALQALDKALNHQRMAEKKAAEFGVTLDVAGSLHLPDQKSAPLPKTRFGATAVMGHSYILHDLFGRKVLEFLRAYGPLVLEETVDREVSQKYLGQIPEGDKLWTIEGRILGASLYLLREKRVDRMIMVSAFSCGPLSIIENYVAWEAQKRGVPLLNLTVDEHTGEAGLITRIEAFMDACAYRQKVRDSKIPLSSICEKNPKGPGNEKECQNPNWVLKPKIGMVNMGTLDIPLSGLFRECGQDVVRPGPLSDSVSAMGKDLAPEFICYPMVTLLGQMRELIEKGVDRILMVGGKGRCRLGWYAQVMEGLLKRKGYDVKVVAVDSPFPWREKGKTFKKALQDLLGSTSALKTLKGVALALTKTAFIDKSFDMVRDIRARERERGQGDRVFSGFLKDMDHASSFKDSISAFRHFSMEISSIERVPKEPVHVLVVGEIYVVNEPFVNRNAEKILGSLEERVMVHRRLTVTNWVGYHLLKTPSAVRDYHRVVDAAENYIPVSVGGHGQESVGEMVLAKKRGMDGVLHLFPFTCMPEIIAQNILVRASKDMDMPVLSIMISEQTGVAGLTTRLEAFCDLLAGRKRRS